MGYYSTFTVTTDKPLSIATVAGPIEEIEPGATLCEIVDALLGGDSEAYVSNGEVVIGGVKWYDMPSDLKQVSREWPGILFTCEQVGEDAERSMTYARDGRVEQVPARITYPTPHWVRA